nr:hypothetical protein Iba_chr06aCG10050 [Ipomoea batatas]
MAQKIPNPQVFPHTSTSWSLEQRRCLYSHNDNGGNPHKVENSTVLMTNNGEEKLQKHSHPVVPASLDHGAQPAPNPILTKIALAPGSPRFARPWCPASTIFVVGEQQE